MKEEAMKFYEKLSFVVLKKMISITLVLTMLVPQLATPITYAMGSLNDTILEDDAVNGVTISLDKEFLEFIEFGEKQTLNYTLLPENSTEEVLFSSSNPESVVVNNSGEVTWVRGVEPVVITATLKNDKDVKAYCFASFEGEASEENSFEEIEDTENVDELSEKTEETEIEEKNDAEEEQQEQRGMDFDGIQKTEITMPSRMSIVVPLALSLGTPQIAQGSNFTAVLKADGTVWTWGNNDNGRLGDGTTVAKNYPVQVKGPNGVGYLSGIVQIASGKGHTIALKADGTVWVWGLNGHAQLGDGTTTQSIYPKRVEGLLLDKKIKYIDAAGLGSGAIDEDGYVYTWGHNNYGQLGLGNTTTPVNQPSQPNAFGLTTGVMEDVEQIAMGVDHSVFLKTDGTVWAVRKKLLWRNRKFR